MQRPENGYSISISHNLEEELDVDQVHHWKVRVMSPFQHWWTLQGSLQSTDRLVAFHSVFEVLVWNHVDFSNWCSGFVVLLKNSWHVNPSYGLQVWTVVTVFFQEEVFNTHTDGMIIPFSSWCSRYVVVHTFCRKACVINLCSGCFCFAVWQVWWHCRKIKDPGPICIRLSEGWNPCTCWPILPWPELSLAHVRFATHLKPLIHYSFAFTNGCLSCHSSLANPTFTNSFLICRAWEPDYVTRMHWIRNWIRRQC